MVELSQVIQTTDGILVPAGVRLHFKNGVAKYQNRPIRRELVPLQAIKGAKGPFLHACVAALLNDNRGFAEAYPDKRFQDWAHFIVSGDNIIVYVWDTREVIDVISGLHAAANGGAITKNYINKATGERTTKTIGHRRFGWAKSLYEMMMWPAYHRVDNGLPLVCKNKDWKQVVDDFNATLAKFAYEAWVGPEGNKVAVFRYTSGHQSELRKAKLPNVKAEPWMHIGVSTRGPKYYFAVWIWDTRQVLCSGEMTKEQVNNVIRSSSFLKQYAVDNGRPLKGSDEAVKALNHSMIARAVEAGEELVVKPAQGIANTHEVWLGDTLVARITAESMKLAHYGANNVTSEQTEGDEPDSAEPTDNEGQVTKLPAYINTDKGKLVVYNAAGDIMELPCLSEDIVTEDDLLADIAKQISA